ncbi:MULTISPECIES: MFS transporter [Burkholderiaceae]|uniref:MFS transporter n=1 Tax=Caballeronia zhejiangensis TaxID=871203 RepID=A0A656Q9H0_9BURK|nr:MULTISPECIES: MFS transporter [Burkholderiaceae]KAK43817.1 MFS transporter [Caballeronia jiangsuensis]KDR25866.1 MFS transporter [Caballeronia zhejiangensis]KWU23796.1 MFS transporter [Burkholderia cenocepacia]SAL78268.1 transporter protein [Caballeronia peredens]
MPTTNNTDAAATVTVRSGSRKMMIAGTVIGNCLEFYDFTVYTYFAVIIGKLYFPSQDPTVSLMSSVATFAAGFITRPLGSLLLGLYADRRGRKAALSLTILLMAFGTGLIAITPTYDQIGVAAPILIVLARLLQGFSQGGEFGTATSTLLEAGDQKARGLRVSWQLATQGTGTILGAGLAALLSATLSREALDAWGWRLPFIFGVLIAPVGIYLRRNLHEDWVASATEGSATGILRELFTTHLRTQILITLTGMGGTVTVYLLNFMPIYAIKTFGLPMATSMLVGVSTGMVTMFAGPLAGATSDRLRSRKTLIFIGRGALLVGLLPAFLFINRTPSVSVILPITACLTFFYAFGSATSFTLMCESLPRAVRATGISIAYAVSVCVFGGTAQFVSVWLVRISGDPVAPAWYATACVAVSLLAVSLLKETGNKSLR